MSARGNGGFRARRLLDALLLGPRRRRRRIVKQLRALDASGVVPIGTRPPRRRQLPERARTVVVASLVCAALVGGWRSGLIDLGRAVAASDAWRVEYAASSAHPPVNVAAHPKRLLPAVTPPPGQGGYTLVDPDAGDARFDPCRPIHYVVSGRETFAGGDAMLRAAIAQVSAATGLRFVDDGRTEEHASKQRAAYQPGRYGERWAPVLVAWTGPDEVPRLKGDVGGLGGPTGAVVRSQARWVTGVVYLDGPDLAAIARRPEGRAAARVVMLHELGHLVGLGHVPDRSQVMYEASGPVGGYGGGDLRGLARMGAGPCYRYQ